MVFEEVGFNDFLENKIYFRNYSKQEDMDVQDFQSIKKVAENEKMWWIDVFVNFGVMVFYDNDHFSFRVFDDTNSLVVMDNVPNNVKDVHDILDTFIYSNMVDILNVFKEVVFGLYSSLNSREGG